MRQRVITVLGASGLEIFVGFGCNCPVKNLFHLHRPQRVTTRGMHADSTIVDAHRRGPLVFVKLLIAERAVLVGLHHKMFDRISEIVVFQPLSLAKKQASELGELGTGTRVLLRRRHHIDLANSNTTVAKHISNLRMLVKQPCPPLDPQRIRTRTIQLLFQIRLD